MRSFSSFERFWHLCLFASFAISQPLFEVLGPAPEFFVIRRSPPSDILVLVLFLLFAVPTLIFILQKLISIASPKLSAIFYFCAIFTLFTLIFLPPALKISTLSENVVLLSIAVIGLSLILLNFYLRSQILRSFLVFLSPAIAAFPLLFIFSSKVSEILQEGDTVLGKAVGKAAQTPVVLVVFDEFNSIPLMDEAKNINEERFPNIAAFVKQGTWYRNASTTTAWTERAVPAIFTGKLPLEGKKQLPSLKDHPQNLFTLLSDSHSLHVLEQVTHLCPSSVCKGQDRDGSLLDRTARLIQDVAVIYLHIVLPEAWRKGWLPEISFSWGDFLQPESSGTPLKVTSKKKGFVDKGDWADDSWLFEQFFKTIHNTSKVDTKPGLYVLHITLPHVPYRFLPSGKKYLKGFDRTNDAGYKKQWGGEEWPTIQAFQRLTIQMMYVDTLIGRLMDTLKAQNLWDSSLVILTADHGSSFQPKEFSRRVSSRNYMDVMLVPMLVKYPGQTSGVTSDRNVWTIDVVPSVLDVLDLKAPQPLDGISFRDPSRQHAGKLFQPLEKGRESRTFDALMPVEPTLSRQLSLFGRDVPGVFRIGPRQDLIGKSAQEVQGISKGDVALEFSEEYARVDLSSEFVPALVSGELRADTEKTENRPLPIAIAINGKFAATSWAEKKNEQTYKFQSLLPEDAFQQGTNVVEVFTLPP